MLGRHERERDRGDTPFGIGGKFGVNTENTRFTFPMFEGGAGHKDGEADYGDSDGEDMSRLARPNHASAITGKRARPKLAKGRSKEDKLKKSKGRNQFFVT